MKKLCIFGAGGFAHEVFWLARQCGHEIEAFIDIHASKPYYGTPVKDDSYFNKEKNLAVVAVGNPKIREKIVKRIIDNYGSNIFATLIHPQANIMSPGVSIGLGSVICANCFLTCDIQLGMFSQLNLSTTIGHDTIVGDFFTTAPGVNISGKIRAGERVYFGTNASIAEGITICDDVIIGAAACVTKDILESGTYIGVPARKLEK
jgi:sugar O-acyltransferase (sialic acid O-acetyltransferase NeuD family)